MWRKKIIFSVGLILLVIIIVTGSGKRQEKKNENKQIESTILSEYFKIPESEIPKLEIEALHGSAVAASKLYYFYHVYKLYYKEAHYWIGIAAENGDSVAQYNYGYLLLNDDFIDSVYSDSKMKIRAKERALFWLKKASENGVELAKELLKEISKSE